MGRRFLCWLGFHKWSKWADPPRTDGCWSYQHRKCEACNKYAEHLF
jgi:hypothetical protein